MKAHYVKSIRSQWQPIADLRHGTCFHELPPELEQSFTPEWQYHSSMRNVNNGIAHIISRIKMQVPGFVLGLRQAQRVSRIQTRPVSQTLSLGKYVYVCG